MAAQSLPETPCPQNAHDWLRTAGISSPSRRSNGDSSQSLASGIMPQEGINMRALEPGSCVCLYTSLGELVTVFREGKHWVLQGVLAPRSPEDDGSPHLPYFPAEAVFLVVRDGSRIGFRSLKAEGRALQAVKDPASPHRVANHNFGAWESWEVTSSGLVNLQWRHKVLDLEVREVRVVAVEDIRKMERRQIHNQRCARTQAKSLEGKLVETEKRLRDVVQASQMQAAKARLEVEDLQQQLATALAARRAASLTAEHSAATLKQLEHRLGELSVEKNSADAAVDHAGQRISDLQSEIRRLRERHGQEIAEKDKLHQRQLAAALEGGPEPKADHLQSHADLEQVLAAKQAEVAQVEQLMRDALQVKDAEIESLLEERERLDAALQSIKGQIQLAASPQSRAQEPGASRASLNVPTLRGLHQALEDAQGSLTKEGSSRPAPASSQHSSATHLESAAPEASLPAATTSEHQRENMPSPSPQQGQMQQEPGQGAAVGVVPPCGLAAALQPRPPSGLAALLNHGSSKATSALYDLLAGGTDTPRSSLATPRILTPAGARRTDVRMSDEVMWRESVDSTSAAAGRGLPRAAGGPSLDVPLQLSAPTLLRASAQELGQQALEPADSAPRRRPPRVPCDLEEGSAQQTALHSPAVLQLTERQPQPLTQLQPASAVGSCTQSPRQWEPECRGERSPLCQSQGVWGSTGLIIEVPDDEQLASDNMFDEFAMRSARKCAGNRGHTGVSSMRNSFNQHPLSPTESTMSEGRRRSSFLGRPLKDKGDLW